MWVLHAKKSAYVDLESTVKSLRGSMKSLCWFFIWKSTISFILFVVLHDLRLPRSMSLKPKEAIYIHHMEDNVVSYFFMMTHHKIKSKRKETTNFQLRKTKLKSGFNYDWYYSQWNAYWYLLYRMGSSASFCWFLTVDRNEKCISCFPTTSLVNELEFIWNVYLQPCHRIYNNKTW